jgi:hypothetical protein
VVRRPSEHEDRSISDAAHASSALLLRREPATSEDRNMSRMLEFFGIPWKTVTARDERVHEIEGRYAIVSSADCMAEMMHVAQNREATLPPWVMKASTVYVYGFRDDDRSTKLLRFLTGNPQAKVRPINVAETIMTITGDFAEMCGAMSGMLVRVTLRGPGCVCDLGPGPDAVQSIVRADEGEVFFGATCGRVRFYLNAWNSTLDISALSPKYFDVRRSFGESVPSVLYLKWAFRSAASRRAETNACLIVDDPPLKRHYGFLDFREALDLMDHHNFTSTIALIPWNSRRTHPHTLSLFRSRPERFSLVVHGCDHTSSEFAVRSPALLNRKIGTSIQRMEDFEQKAAIKAERVMVFPQGAFSPEAGRTLKLNGFLAAVNTEVAPAQRAANETTIADLWSVAIMKYGTFPIFTRRYPDHGIENFAFDGLLGKPCLIAAHHDVFRDHARNLIDLVERLNSLQWKLVWQPLGEVLRRSFTLHLLDGCTSVIRMFAGSLLVANPGDEPLKTLLLKQECDPDCVQTVSVNQTPVDFSVEGGYLQLRLTIPPGEAATVCVAYRGELEAIPGGDSLRTTLKVAARRYLSEFRDNYISRHDFLYQSAIRLKHLILSDSRK